MLNLVNLKQTPQERRNKFKFCRRAGINSYVAAEMRDWTWNHIQLTVEARTGKKPIKPNKKGKRFYLPF
jgi:hypothetical protein